MKHFDKVVACVLIDIGDSPKILAFEHPPPLSDFQIPKGTIEENEDQKVAVLRELEEESGLSDCKIESYIGNFDFVCPGGINGDLELESQTWNIFHLSLDDPPKENWTHIVSGSGVDAGLAYRYFWFDLNHEPSRFDPKFVKLFAKVQSYLDKF